jgi:hypothetical protein
VKRRNPSNAATSPRATASCGGEKAGPSLVDRRKGGLKRSVAAEATGVPLGLVSDGANRHDSPLLAPTLGQLRGLAETGDGTGAAHGAGRDTGRAADTGRPAGPGERSWTVEQVLDLNGIMYVKKSKPGGAVYLLDRCLTSDAHEDGAALLEQPSGVLSYRCQHDTRAGKRWADAKPALRFPERPGFSRFSRTLVADTQRPAAGAQTTGALLGDDPEIPFRHFSRFSRMGSSAEALAEAFAEVPELAPDERPNADARAAAEVAREIWLEPYIRAAEERYPMSPRSLHEAAGLTALLTADARRHYVQAGHKRLYASLNLLFVAESGVAKTDGLTFLREVVRAAG